MITAILTLRMTEMVMVTTVINGIDDDDYDDEK